jgi:hypothetical protein
MSLVFYPNQKLPLQIFDKKYFCTEVLPNRKKIIGKLRVSMSPVIKYQSLRRSIKRLSLRPHTLGTGSSLGFCVIRSIYSRIYHAAEQNGKKKMGDQKKKNLGAL